MRHLLIALFAIILLQPIFAQEENPPIVTDRPDWTESAITVPHKSFQIESGFVYGWDEQDDISTKDIGYSASMFRYGITKRFEARLGLAFAGYEENSEVSEKNVDKSGMIPLIVGFKWNFLYGDGPLPTMALLSHINIPKAASKDYSDGDVMHNIVIAGSWPLSKVFSLGFNFGWRIDWAEYDFETLYTTSLSASITKWMGAFVEFYGFFPTGEYADHRFDMGLTFPVRHNLQFDISGGVGISDNSPDGFGSIGFAWRIPR